MPDSLRAQCPNSGHYARAVFPIVVFSRAIFSFIGMAFEAGRAGNWTNDPLPGRTGDWPYRTCTWRPGLAISRHVRNFNLFIIGRRSVGFLGLGPAFMKQDQGVDEVASSGRPPRAYFEITGRARAHGEMQMRVSVAAVMRPGSAGLAGTRNHLPRDYFRAYRQFREGLEVLVF